MVQRSGQVHGERDALAKWASKRDKAELDTYRREHNQVSIDGFPSGMYEAG